MKYKTNILTAAIAATTLYTSAAYTHGENSAHDDKPEYDAVSKPFGEYDPELKPTRTIEVIMADTMRFTPAEVTINAGDVIRFVVANDGKLMHEFVLGTPDSLSEHADLMVKFPNMEHEEPYMAHVPPGEEMDIIWKFTKNGNYEFGCLLPGHFAAGMKGSIAVK